MLSNEALKHIMNLKNMKLKLKFQIVKVMKNSSKTQSSQCFVKITFAYKFWTSHCIWTPNTTIEVSI